MGFPQPAGTQLHGLPYRGVAVFQESPDKAGDFCRQLREAVAAHPAGTCTFENIDVSKVTWPTESFQELIDVLLEFGVSTQRLKAFKCSLNDEAITLLADWLANLEPAKMPSEIHLSHNQMTCDGFLNLFEVLEQKRAQLSGASKTIPVWLRVESNKVEEVMLNDLQKQGRICFCPVIRDQARMGNRDAVAAMPGGSAGFNKPAPQQAHSGASSFPAPQWGKGNAGKAAMPALGKGNAGKAAAPALGKGSWNGGSSSSSAGGGGGKSWGKGQNDGGSSWNQASQNQRPSKWDVKPDNGRGASAWKGNDDKKWDKDEKRVHPGSKGIGYTWDEFLEFCKGNQRQAEKMWDESSPMQDAGASKQPHNSQTRDAGGRASQQQKPAQQAEVQPQPAKKPKVEEAPLPKPWTKEFSEEYKIPYYWNPVTGDSVWERPTA